ncbi:MULTISPECIES: ABC transporter ATP-binding protein [Heyndrickxia]|jgi:spermidine/putrescine ABC transporter ATP-binding subunit|uniref:Spermidine/putrescine import ATP-binding protein PotA n=2 Tax=Heyndrickxia TaxID=2837504 RepID=A0A133KNH5_HEYCO|nr:ABC transporter ATP-binding protein [Heyndrickxia coagulans]AWP36471.1 ABC transporter ATP-binding protein [Heyndrickxia coagulans]KWZ81091.1 putative spermidine/putrescine ABC transporter, ATP-binding protein PotA [Heyndrickxia coagulans]QDI61977.1 ABC transporter ATP-binding protein [Heyndrickxia coagulans]UXC23416.1 ABC transporter ATP-binding protein [Heyndrickxia coagulans]
MSFLKLDGISKKFKDVEVVKELSLDLEKGELVSFLGPSGCGKTTTLNMIAGFLEIDSGDILVEGNSIGHLPPNKRNMGMVFQSYALFPHMTVFENVAYGLKLRKVKKAEIKKRVEEALKLTQLIGFEQRYPKELSGGQQQRVSIARAIVIQPKVLLLDEPLSNLDAKLRKQMREDIVQIQKSIGITTIFVTHDQEEALAISDRIAVMNKGKIEQIGSPFEIYNHPKTDFVSEFIGEVNEFKGKVMRRTEDFCTVDIHGLEFAIPNEFATGTEISFFVRPENIRITKEKPLSQPSLISKVERKMFLGSKTRYTLFIKGQKVIADVPSNEKDAVDLGKGSEAYIYWKNDELLNIRG